MFLPRVVPALALILVLTACATDNRQALVTSSATPSFATTQATAQVDLVASSTPRPTLRPTRVPPTEAPEFTATLTPTVMPAPTFMPSPTVTALPAATATPSLTQADQTPQPPQVAHSYVFPVRSEGNISYGRFHHDYPAADIFCSVGSEFLAVTDGVVDYVSNDDLWDPAVNDGATRGGLSVAIIGDDGVRYYGSHLARVADRIEPGARVLVGQLLGLTGKSGDARDTDPHLHFGISRPTTPDDWQVRRGQIPPYDYLRAWQRGEAVTPELP